MLPYTRGYMLPAVVLKKEEGWQEEILKELKEVLHLLKGRENEYQIAGKLVFVWQIFIEHMKSEVVKPTRSYIRKQERIQAMLTYIHEHYMEEIRLREIAEAAAVSVGECCRISDVPECMRRRSDYFGTGCRESVILPDPSGDDGCAALSAVIIGTIQPGKESE